MNITTHIVYKLYGTDGLKRISYKSTDRASNTDNAIKIILDELPNNPRIDSLNTNLYDYVYEHILDIIKVLEQYDMYIHIEKLVSLIEEDIEMVSSLHDVKTVDIIIKVYTKDLSDEDKIGMISFMMDDAYRIMNFKIAYHLYHLYDLDINELYYCKDEIKSNQNTIKKYNDNIIQEDIFSLSVSYYNNIHQHHIEDIDYEPYTKDEIKKWILSINVDKMHEIEL